MKDNLVIVKTKIIRTLSLINQAKKICRNCNVDNHDYFGSISVLNKFPSFRIDQKANEIVYLLKLIEKHNMKVICEIGAHRGGSLSLFCKAASKNATIISVDIDYPFNRKIANKFLSDQGQRIICIKGDSREIRTIKNVKRVLKGKLIDLLFIDGDHSFLGVTSDYSNYSPLVKEGGLIAFHDIHPDHNFHFKKKTDAYVGHVPQFWNAIRSTYEQTEEIIDDIEQEGYGIGILYKK